MCVASLLTWSKPNCNETFSIALPSLVVMWFLRHLHDFASILPRSTTRKDYFALQTQDLTQEIFFAVLWLGPGLSSTLSHSNSKLHVNCT